MNGKLILNFVFLVACIVSAAILVCGLFSFCLQDPALCSSKLALIGLSAFGTALYGFFMTRLQSEQDKRAGIREGFAIVAFSWIAACMIGMIPYVAVCGMFPHDAFFETVSGFSTTGASVIDPSLRLFHGGTLPDGIESLPKGLLLWRSLTIWLGGMGIVVLTLVILPLMNISGQMLYNAEMTGVKSMDSQFTPRIATTAKILWLVYVFLTVLETVLLRFGGLNWFDALCHSFATISTGGFSTKSAGVASFSTPYIDWVITAFMFASGCNFLLHFRLVTGKPLSYLKNDEFRFYSLAIVIATLMIAWQLLTTPGLKDSILPGTQGMHCEHNVMNSLRYAAFHVVSIITSTGFTTANYCAWPTFVSALLFCLMISGGCGGSTAGGLKCCRVLLLARQGACEIRRCFFPRLIQDLRLNGVRMEQSTVHKTLAFFSIFVILYLFFGILLPFLCPEMTLETALSASLACLSNIGPAFGQLGPTHSYAWVSAPAKIAMGIEMLLGRLELYTILVLLMPSFWKH